jgi:hypothetical protein
MKIKRNKANGPVDRIKIGLGIAVLAGLTGCVGYVDGGYVDVTTVREWWWRSLMHVFWGGGYDRGRDVHDYSHRGV